MLGVKVRVLTNIIAPSHSKSMLRHLVKKFELDKKYPDAAKHLDRVFNRAVNPITNQREVWLEGNAVLAAIKCAIGVVGKPIDFPVVFGMYFPEDCTNVVIKHVTKNDGTTTLFVSEVIIPDSVGILLLKDLPKEKYMPDRIQIGAMQKKGFGLVEILWQKGGKE